MAREGEWYIWIGSWLSTLVLVPLGVILTYQSNRDSTILNMDAYKEFFRKLFGIKEKRNITLKEVIIEDPDYAADYKKLDEIAHISHKFRKDNKLKKLPSLKRIFFREGNESVIVNMSEELDMLAEEMGNSKNKKVIIYINELPIIEAKAITSPIDNKWLNILAIIVFPIGTAIYIRACIYRLRLLRDLIKLEQTSKKLIEILVKEKLV